MMGKKASRGAPHTQLWENLSTQLPEQLTYEIFTLASTLRPQKLDCSDVPLLGKIPSDDDLASWTSDARERSKWDRDAPGFDERCAMAEVQLRTLPSLSRLIREDVLVVTRLEAMILVAGTTYLRAVSPAMRDAVDAMASAVHLARIGFPPANATTRIPSVKDHNREVIYEMMEEDGWDAWTHLQLKHLPAEIDAAGGWDAWYSAHREIETGGGIYERTFWCPYNMWANRTRRRSALTPLTPHVALLDRAHAVLAHRAAAHYYRDSVGYPGSEDDECYGQALEKTFFARASMMPWPFDASEIYISRDDMETDDYASARPPAHFDATDPRCAKFRTFALALAPPGTQLGDISPGETKRVDLLKHDDRDPEVIENFCLFRRPDLLLTREIDMLVSQALSPSARVATTCCPQMNLTRIGRLRGRTLAGAAATRCAQWICACPTRDHTRPCSGMRPSKALITRSREVTKL